MNHIFENFNNLKITQNAPKNQMFEKFKKSCKEASNKKSENRLQLDMNNIKNDIFEKGLS